MKNIDKKQPYNDLPNLPPDYNFDEVYILKAVKECNIYLSELKGVSKIFDENISYNLLMPLTSREAVKSSNIENINSTMMSILESEYLSATEIKFNDKETISYREALIGGFDKIRNNNFLITKNIIEEIQMEYLKIDNKLNLGVREKRFKENGEEILCRIVNHSVGEIIYTPPNDKELINKLLNNICDFLNNKEDEMDPLVKIAISHYQFEAIHPFEDGNGRIGRIIFVLSFLIHNRLNIPVLYISDYLLKNKSEYYKLLNQVTFENNWKDFIIFIINGIRLQSIETIATFEKIKVFIDKVEKVLKENKLKINSKCIIKNLGININGLSKSANISVNTSSSYLNKLKNIGLLTEIKIGKEKVFYSKEYIDILSGE